MTEEDTCSNLPFRIWLLQFFLLLGLLAFFIWLGIRPKSPNYTVTDFSIQNGSIPFAIEFNNPNKESQIYFSNINITIYNNQELQGSTLISSFTQGKEETSPRNGVIVLDNKVRKALEVQIAKGSTQLVITLVTKIRYRTWGIKSPHQKVHQKGELPVGPDGKMPGKNKLKNGAKKWRIRLYAHLV